MVWGEARVLVHAALIPIGILPRKREQLHERCLRHEHRAELTETERMQKCTTGSSTKHSQSSAHIRSQSWSINIVDDAARVRALHVLDEFSLVSGHVDLPGVRRRLIFLRRSRSEKQGEMSRSMLSDSQAQQSATRSEQKRLNHGPGKRAGRKQSSTCSFNNRKPQ